MYKFVEQYREDCKKYGIEDKLSYEITFNQYKTLADFMYPSTEKAKALAKYNYKMNYYDCEWYKYNNGEDSLFTNWTKEHAEAFIDDVKNGTAPFDINIDVFLDTVYNNMIEYAARKILDVID